MELTCREKFNFESMTTPRTWTCFSDTRTVAITSSTRIGFVQLIYPYHSQLVCWRSHCPSVCEVILKDMNKMFCPKPQKGMARIMCKIRGIYHDDVIKWKHFPRYWPFVRESTVGFPSQRPVTRGIDISLICAWANAWVNNRDPGDLRRHGAHYDVTVLAYCEWY